MTLIFPGEKEKRFQVCLVENSRGIMKKEARKEGRHQKKEGSMKDRKKERTLARNEGKRQGTNEQANEETPKERKIATQFLPRLVSLT